MENQAEKNQEAVNAELTDKELEKTSGGAVETFQPIDGVTGEGGGNTIGTITPTVTVPTPIQAPKSIVS